MSKKNDRKPEFVIVWEFRVKPGKRPEFETMYGWTATGYASSATAKSTFARSLSAMLKRRAAI